MTTTVIIPTLRTERLILRAPEMRDLDAYAEYCASDRAVMIGGPFGLTDSYTRLCQMIGQWQLRGYGRWIIADAATGETLGAIGINHPIDWPEPEIAWSVYASAEGRGIAYEAAQAVRAYAYGTVGLETIVSYITSDNVRSQNLAKRMGAVLDGVLDHPEHGALDIWRHPAAEVAA